MIQTHFADKLELIQLFTVFVFSLVELLNSSSVDDCFLSFGCRFLLCEAGSKWQVYQIKLSIFDRYRLDMKRCTQKKKQWNLISLKKNMETDEGKGEGEQVTQYKSSKWIENIFHLKNWKQYNNRQSENHFHLSDIVQSVDLNRFGFFAPLTNSLSNTLL